MFVRPILLALALSGSIVASGAVHAAPATSAKPVKAEGVARVRSSHGFALMLADLKLAIHKSSDFPVSAWVKIGAC
jgi:hypothetical protein